MTDEEDIIEIRLDDLDPEKNGTADVLQVEVDEPPPLGGQRPSRPKEVDSMREKTVAPSAELDTVPPMTRGGVCPRCGFAPPPLDRECPRCARMGAQAAEPYPTEPDAQAFSPSYGTIPPQHGRFGTSLVVIIVLLAGLSAGLGVTVWRLPAQRAKREYAAGIRAQLKANFSEARRHYKRALALDPELALAAFALGTTYLGIGDPALVEYIEKLTQKAIWGQTKELDEADQWFRQAIELSRRMSPRKALIDQRVKTPARLRALCHTCLAITALLRANAALQAEAFEDSLRWYGVFQREAQAALFEDPSAEESARLLREQEALPPNSKIR